MSDDYAQPETDTAPDPATEALKSLAKPEDITSYVEARTGADTEEELAENRDQVEQALEEARQRTREAREQSAELDQEYNQAEAEWQAQQQQEQALQQQLAAKLSYHEQKGRLMERAF